MNKENHYEKKRKLIQKQQQNTTTNNNHGDDDDDEQIKKTLNFLDSILDQYILDENEIKKSYSQIKSMDNISRQQSKQNFHNIKSIYTTTQPPLENSSQFQVPHAYQHRNLRRHAEQTTSNSDTNHVHRRISENNLDHVTSPSKPSIEKVPRRKLLQTTATTSTEDLSTNPLRKNFPRQDRFSVFIDKTNHLIPNYTSASLIDLTSIDKLSPRPHFRFIPPSIPDLSLQEEHKIEQQSNLNDDQFYVKRVPIDQTSFDNRNKYNHRIVKPTVIIPPIPKATPVTRLAESKIHHENENSAFKPHRPNKNDVSSKMPQSPPTSDTKRTESMDQSNIHVGITNPISQISDIGLPNRPKQAPLAYHQSIFNISSTSETFEKPSANMFTSQISDPTIPTNFIKQPPYTPQLTKLNVYHRYPPPVNFEDPISKRIQQVNNSSSMNGIVYSSCNPPYLAYGGENRSQQPVDSYGFYMPINSGVPPTMNGSDHMHRRQTYSNPVNIHKYASPQQSVPIQSVYLASPRISRDPVSSSSSNVYRFNQNDAFREGRLKPHSHHQNVTYTTYL